MSEPISIQQLINAGIDAETASEFLESFNDTLTTRKGSVKKTLTGIDNEAQERVTDAIQGAYGIDIGDYESDLTITNYNQYVVFDRLGASTGPSQWKALDTTPLPYAIDSTTYPNPVNDPNLTAFSDINRDGATQLITEISDIVYKAGGGNSAIENMIAGVPVAADVGDICSTFQTVWERVSLSSPSVISDFKKINDLSAKANGANGDGTDQTSQINGSISPGGKTLIPSGTYTVTSTPQIGVDTNIYGDGSQETIIDAPNGFIDNSGSRVDDMKITDLTIKGPGRTSGTGIKRDGTVNSNRETYKNLRVLDYLIGIDSSAGWGQEFDKLFVRGCGTGFKSSESSFSPSWGGSGLLVTNSYFAGNTIGIDDAYSWQSCYINCVIENNSLGYKQSTRGNTAVMINTWWEDNGAPPEWRQGSVIIGGRGNDFSDIALFNGQPRDCLVHADGRWGLGVSRNEHLDIFDANGRGISTFNTYYPDLHWTIEDKPVQDGVGVHSESRQVKFYRGSAITSTYSQDADGDVPLGTWQKMTNITAKPHFFQSEVESVADIGVHIEGRASSGGSGVGAVRVVFSSGLFSRTGSGENTYADRWMVSDAGNLDPVSDGAYDIGSSASNRVRDIRVINSPIVGSDSRIKKEISSIPQELLDFAMTVELKQYKLRDRERFHYGIIIDSEFLLSLSNVVDLDSCAAFCRDIFVKLEDDGTETPITSVVNGVELGDMWQVRYDEWQNILLESMRRKINKL